MPFFVSGLRVVHADRHTGYAPGGVRDRPRVYLRHEKAAANDHVGRGKGANPGKKPHII